MSLVDPAANDTVTVVGASSSPQLSVTASTSTSLSSSTPLPTSSSSSPSSASTVTAAPPLGTASTGGSSDAMLRKSNPGSKGALLGGEELRTFTIVRPDTDYEFLDYVRFSFIHIFIYL